MLFHFMQPLVDAPLLAVLVLFGIHFFGDFPLQFSWMAVNKSKEWLALFAHTVTYSICFFAFGFQFVLLTFVLHTATDAITSRVTSHYREQHKIRKYFVTIGFDQYIHACCLIGTWYWVFLRHP